MNAMKTVGRRAAGACALALALPATTAAATVIHAGRLIDGQSDKVRTAVTITIEADRIVRVVEGYTPPAPGDTLIDLKSATVMPGLMDMHVHISSQQSGAAGYAERFYSGLTGRDAGGNLSLRVPLWTDAQGETRLQQPAANHPSISTTPTKEHKP